MSLVRYHGCIPPLALLLMNCRELREVVVNEKIIALMEDVVGSDVVKPRAGAIMIN